MYKNTFAEFDSSSNTYTIKESETSVSVDDKSPKLGVLLVGLAGNNGTTFLGSLCAHKRNLTWVDRKGEQAPSFFGSISQCTDIPVGFTPKTKKIVYQPIKKLCDFVDIGDISVHGWDIDSCDLYNAMMRTEVLPYGLTSQLSDLKDTTAWPGLYYPDYIATNQKTRATNTIKGDVACLEHLNILRQNIKNFKKQSGIEKVVVMWSANTERMVEEVKGVHDTWENLANAIERRDPRISASMMYACAALQENCFFINCAPQNTIVPAIVQLAQKNNMFVGGNDLKSGQTKVKSVFSDFLVSSGFKLRSVVSYNHLGNNDGKNLSEQPQLNAKKSSKTDLLDSIVESASTLYPDVTDRPDHTVVIKYQPYVKDDKRAMDEYISEVAMGAQHIVSMYSICPDSLLALGVMLDIILFSEWCSRIKLGTGRLGPVLDVLSMFFKNPLNAQTNRFFQQRDQLTHLILATNKIPAFVPGNCFLGL